MKPERWKEVERLFNAALELEPARRVAFLNEACAGDDSLRVEVESLLKHEDQPRGFIEVPAMEMFARDLVADSASSEVTFPAIGKIISHYRIVKKIGKGGMGEVFRAKDQKLGRDVAIKILPEEFAKDADRVARFQREAKLLASLNHPNIAAIYGLEEFGGTKFLILELVGGETLAEQLKRGPIPVEESLKLALQIAEALEAAHEKGVIHRDLKPANIKVTPDAMVKVLDFGLAKAFAGEQAELNLSNSPTLSNVTTQQGVILGTAAYMSPEQARGKSVDRRADIWAFGCVLYEMLTGRAAFQGEDVSEILASVIKGDVKLDLLPRNIHPRIRELFAHCLQKDLKKRYRDVGDLQFELEQILADPRGVLVQASPEPRQVIRFDYQLPKGQQFSPGSGLQFNPGSVLAVSPDGRQFVYATPKGLYLRSMDESASKPIAGTEGGTRQPFFSPDGKWIGYYSAADHKLKKIAINGGVPVALCDVQQFLGASWGEDNTIVYAQDPGGVMRISGNGGTSESLIKAKSGVFDGPQILPDGESVLYAAYANPQNPTSARIMVQGGKPGEPKELFAGYGARYLPTGHIVYELQDNIYAIPFNLARLEVTGGTVGLVETVSGFAVSDAGTLIYTPQSFLSASMPGSTTLVWVDREGKEEPIAAPPNVYFSPKISPDGTRVTLSVVNGGDQTYSIQIWDLARKTLSRLTSGEKQDLQSIWTPDGKRIIFSSGLLGTNTLCWKAADGTGEVEKLASSVPGRQLHPWSISSDGKNLAIAEMMGTRFGITMMSMESDRALKPLLHDEKYNEFQPKISPNGKWMAYDSDESGQNEVYVRSFPDVDKAKCQVSTSGGTSPLWSPSGRELFYLSNENFVMATAVQTKPTFSFGTPKVLFRSTYLGMRNNIGHPWDISPNGKRFLMMKEIGPTAPAVEAPRLKINIVLNWTEELKQRVPVK